MATSGCSAVSPRTSALPPTADIQAPRPLSRRFRLLYPQQQTFWARLEMSQVDPFRTYEHDGARFPIRRRKSTSPRSGDALRQVLEQRMRPAQIRCFETFGEPMVYWSQQLTCLS